VAMKVLPGMAAVGLGLAAGMLWMLAAADLP
jgi:hypothetical protein